MPTPSHIQVRDARDRLIDLLKIGQTYPLRDVPVPDDQLTVPVDSNAQVAVENSQPDVSYQLHDTDNQPVKRQATDKLIQARGNGATILMETDPIQEDVTFKIHATKLGSDKAAYLHQTATTKVGLDTRLNAWIRRKEPFLDADVVPFLDPSIDAHAPTDARIIYYGQRVEVEVEKSQEGVDYTLVYVKDEKEILLSVAEVRGDRNNIILRSQPVLEDTDIRIRATKVFDVTENRPTQTDLLAVVLALKVRANPAVPVSAVSPIIDFQQPATITLTETQVSTQYKLYVKTIPDPDFVRDTNAEADVVRVSVDKKPDVQVRTPERQDIWEAPEDFRALGVFQDGTGGELQFATEALTEDSLIIVQAQKKHQATQYVLSAVQLEQAVVVLVRPNPTPPLRVWVPIEKAAASGTLQVSEGQPGVFYYFRRDKDSQKIDFPAYFHQKDARDTNLNKGIGQLALGVDFVIAAQVSAETSQAAPNLAELPPQPPILAIAKWRTDSSLSIRALKAQTGVETSLEQTANIVFSPEVQPREAVIDHNTATDILVMASQTDERHQLFQVGQSGFDGQPLGEAADGNGNTLAFPTGILTEDTHFELLVTRPADPSIAVERAIRVQVAVRPNTTLALSPAQPSVGKLHATQILVEASQLSVHYQLLQLGIDAQPLGERVQGTGDTIALATDLLVRDTSFAVRATKVDRADIAAQLEQHVSVTVESDVEEASIQNAPLLEPTDETPAPEAPRVIFYNKQAEVEIRSSQTGVEYALVCVQQSKADASQLEEVTLSEATSPGTQGTILLRTHAIAEDTDIRVRATQTSDAARNRPPLTYVLETSLPLKVRANPAVGVSVTTAIVDFQTTATVTIADSQPSVWYQLYAHKILDADFVRTELVDADVLQVSVADKPEVQVRAPDRQETWQTSEGYSPVGAAQPGTGGELQLESDALTDDSLIIVQAQKNHQAAAVVPSAVQLEQAVMVLVRPNPAPPLQLQILAKDAVPGGGLQVSDGQPGVLYYFRRTSQGEELGLPAYFHKKDDNDAQLDKGVGQIALEIDFVVARDGSVELPVLDIENLKPGNVFYVRAVKAQTGVETALGARVRIPSDDEA